MTHKLRGYTCGLEKDATSLLLGLNLEGVNWGESLFILVGVLIVTNNTTIDIYLSFLKKRSLVCLEGKSISSRQGTAFLFRSSQQFPVSVSCFASSTNLNMVVKTHFFNTDP